MVVLAVLRFSRSFGHVPFYIAEMRLEEHREMVNTRDGTMLCINVRMRMRMIGRVGVSVSVRLRSHCGRRNAREKASIE